MKQYGFGVDIGGTTCKIGFFDMSGTVLEKWEIKTNTENGGASILDDVAAEVLGKLREKGIKKEDVQGIGLGVPGPVGSDGTVYKCVNLGWDIFNVETELYKKTGLLVKAGNDANVAALGEMWQGGGKSYDSVVMITLGTGVGGGVIERGRLIAGNFGMGGELGHMIMNPNEPDACNCGGHGCLEQYTSATGIVRVARRFLAQEDTPSSLRAVENLTAKDVLDAAKAGDDLAVRSVDCSMRYLGWAMAHISHMTDPQCFVIGGGVSKAGQYLLDVIRRHYESFLFIQKPQAKICLATLGNDAGIFGAARLILGE